MELKLAFLTDVDPRADLKQLLLSYATSLDRLRADAEEARTALRPTLSASARVALDLGIHQMRSTAAWCRRTARRHETTP